MKRLGIIVNSPSPHQKSLLDALVSLTEIDVLVAYAFHSNPRRTWGVPKVAGESAMVPWQLGLRCAKRLTEWVRSEDCDVWILGSVFTALRTQLLVGALCNSGKPWAFLGEPPRPRTGWHGVIRDQLLNRVLKKCDGVVATGVESARRYQRLLADDRPITSVPYYIPLDEWRALPLVEPLQPNQLIKFVTLAQLIPRKGLDILIDACRQLPTTGWSLDIYGDGPERERLEQAIANSSLPITIHPPLPFETRTAGFQDKHCFVLPTRWDGWGMVVVEALAAGLPVISSDQAMSAHDFIESGRSGWMVDCDKGSIAEAMTQVIENPDAIPGKSIEARNSLSGYCPEAGATEMIDFCHRLVDRKARGQKP